MPLLTSFLRNEVICHDANMVLLKIITRAKKMWVVFGDFQAAVASSCALRVVRTLHGLNMIICCCGPAGVNRQQDKQTDFRIQAGA